MAITNAERDQLIAMTGCGLMPIPGLTGGPTGSPIAQTAPYWAATATVTPTTQVMNLSAIYLPLGVTVRQITVAAIGAATTPTDYWNALYDDGRGTTTANQLALLGQTADNTGARGANALLTQTMITPYVTQYAGIYYVALMDKAATPSTVAGTVAKGSTAVVNYVSVAGAINTGSHLAATAGSALVATAPNPSGALTATAAMVWFLVSS